MSVILAIVRLQEIDDRLSTIRAGIASLRDRIARSEELDNARRQLQHVTSRISKGEKLQRGLEAEVADLTARIEPEEARLFSGSITSSKELMGIQQEVELLKAKRSGIEDRLLEVMGQLESLEPRRSAARRAVQEAEKAWEQQQQELHIQLRRYEDDLALTEQQRAGQAAGVQPRPLRLYEDLRNRKGGAAVARLQGHACGSCRVALPDVVRKQVLLRDAVVQCPHCEKILAPG
jgi:uncharacterized protein